MSFFNSIPTASATDAAQAAAGAVLVDVRMPEEFAAGHAQGAMNCPLPTLGACVDKLKSSSVVYVLCRSGGRSAMAVPKLKAMGVNAVNVSGGTMAWESRGLPLAYGL